MTALAVMPRGCPVRGSVTLSTATPLASRDIVDRNAAMPTGGRRPRRSEERVTGVEREPELHPPVVLGRRVEVAEHVAGDSPHIPPAALDRALVAQCAGPG